MKNNVVGLVGVGIRNGLWNADFSKYSKTYTDGSMYASPYSLKYAVRNYLDITGEKILSRKKLKMAKDKNGVLKSLPMTLEEKYEDITNTTLRDSDMDTVIKNLYDIADVKLFGVAFAVDGYNLSLYGTVQFSNGDNLDTQTQEYTDCVMSPFKNSNEKSKDKQQSTLGEAIFVDEAHYCYNMNICPKNILEISNAEFTDDDYNKLVKGIMNGPNSIVSVAKNGAESEFMLAVHLKEDYILDQTVLNDKVKCKRNGNKVDYDFTELIDYLNKRSNFIEKIEFYVNDERVNYDFTGLNIKPIITEIGNVM